MLIFIDESGDPGFKVGQGSSHSFVIACVCFTDPSHAESTANIIRTYRDSLGWKESSEFKFSKSRKDIRLGFLKEVSGSPFTVRAIVFQKKSIYSSTLKNNKDRFYNFATRKILDTLGSQLEAANIKIDGSGDRAFKQDMERYLRGYLHGRIGKLRFVNSQTNVLIQLADMCAGAINRSFGDTPDRQIYRSIIQKNIVDVWDFK